MKNTNPYFDLPDKAFWKTAIAAKSMFDISELWDPKFHIKFGENVVTFGSCFAQHIGRAMSNRGFNWLATERAPDALSAESKKQFNYDIFSARTGNIYTTSLLLQWVEWALGYKEIPDEVWEKGGRFYDPFRPRIEPNGFASKDEVVASRLETVKAFKTAITTTDYFVFTLGLTESWHNEELQYEYPMCPGTVAGEYDDSVHKFKNLDFNDVQESLGEAMRLIRKANQGIRFILTVSPVPLTATNSGQHVLVATMASKSILRAVAQHFLKRKIVDYYPSYEIINSPVFRGGFFEPNQRSVNPYGVNFVMNQFFACLEGKYGSYVAASTTSEKTNHDEVCEEELLEAFQQ